MLAEVARGKVVTRVARSLLLQLRHLNDQHSLGRVHADRRQLRLHDGRFGLADVEVGVGGSGQDVGQSSEQSRLLGR